MNPIPPAFAQFDVKTWSINYGLLSAPFAGTSASVSSEWVECTLSDGTVSLTLTFQRGTTNGNITVVAATKVSVTLPFENFEPFHTAFDTMAKSGNPQIAVKPSGAASAVFLAINGKSIQI